MEVKDAIKDVIKELITKELVEQIIRDEVQKLFTYSIERSIQSEADRIVRERAGQYLQEEVDRVINGNMIRTDDGWGNVEKYGSFDEFVRQKISKELRTSWQIEKKIRDATYEQLSRFIKAVIDEGKTSMIDIGVKEVCTLALMKEGK